MYEEINQQFGKIREVNPPKRLATSYTVRDDITVIGQDTRQKWNDIQKNEEKLRDANETLIGLKQYTDSLLDGTIQDLDRQINMILDPNAKDISPLLKLYQ